MSATPIFSDLRTEWDTPERNFKTKEKGHTACVNHSVCWFQREKLNFISYIFHIPWKEVVKDSTWYTDKEITDFLWPIGNYIYLERKQLYNICLAWSQVLLAVSPMDTDYGLLLVSSIQKAIYIHYKQFETNKKTYNMKIYLVKLRLRS